MEKTKHRMIGILIRLIIAAGFAVLAALFLAPLSVKIINIGNAFGFIVCASAAVISLFWPLFTKLAGRIWQSLPGKIFLASSGVLLAGGFILCGILSCLMLSEINDPPKNNDTTLVLLGCKVNKGGPSLMLSRRIKAAGKFLAEHPDIPVVVSGGQGEDEYISEAECMRSYLVQLGISEDRIYMEDKSEDTKENLLFSRKVIEENGLPATITLCTDGFHQYRAEMLARQQGIKSTYNISASTPGWLLPTYWVREWFGIVFYTIKR